MKKIKNQCPSYCPMSILANIYYTISVLFKNKSCLKISAELFASKTSLQVTSQLPLTPFYLKKCVITIMLTFILFFLCFLFFWCVSYKLQ